ncbi:DUF6114 domain-containing protein [Actinospica robiniae]|uniref:DUF6114 domain-containing protein n=1 Tax=Actinospica robiniae TaxID=304901 RepID=UPI0003FBB89B|nr:DUF6114 domain-containing protein [Actinospica robiniae]
MITNPGQVSSGADRALDRFLGPIGRAWDRFAAPTERFRRPFRRWRRGRPFTAGICILLAGAEIPLVTQSALGKLLSMGVPGISTIFISVFLIIFAVTIWFYPAYRVFSGIAAIMVALLSLIATNLGGFLLGFLLAMLGGAFAVAWAPRAHYTEDTRRQRRAAARTHAADQLNQNPETSAAEPAGATAPSTATDEQATAPLDTAAPAAEPAEPAEPAAESADDAAGPDHARNTEIIEHYARPDEADTAPSEPAPEEE